MITIRITRDWKLKDYTIGKLYVDGVYWCNVLEDTDRGLHSSMTDAEIKRKKIYGQTAIPRGQYSVSLAQSPKFSSRTWAKKYGGLVPLIHGVKGFDGIRIHPGSKASDTLGCVLPGENTIKGQVTSSTKWYYKLMDEVFMPAYRNGTTVVIEIV